MATDEGFKQFQIIFLKNWAIHGLFFNYFCLIKQTVQFFTTNKCPSSIQCWDSNPQPSEHESPPITTRPGLPPKSFLTILKTYSNCFYDAQVEGSGIVIDKVSQHVISSWCIWTNNYRYFQLLFGYFNALAYQGKQFRFYPHQ